LTSFPHVLLCQYGYDPLDRLTSHEQSANHACQRFYCRSRLVTEIQGALHCSIIQHDDHLLAQLKSDGDVQATTLLATGQERSVLNTLKTDYPSQPINYSPYGHIYCSNGLLSLLGFNGERPEPVTGHYLLGNGYRAFNPILMRFNCPDSLSPFDKGGLNAYAYCSNDPVNQTDPTGRIGLFRVPRTTSVRFRGKLSTPIAQQSPPITSGSDLQRQSAALTSARPLKVFNAEGSINPDIDFLVRTEIDRVANLDYPWNGSKPIVARYHSDKRRLHLLRHATSKPEHPDIFKNLVNLSDQGFMFDPSEVKFARGHWETLSDTPIRAMNREILANQKFMQREARTLLAQAWEVRGTKKRN
jgi:RHS repeat-associated protein